MLHGGHSAPSDAQDGPLVLTSQPHTPSAGTGCAGFTNIDCAARCWPATECCGAEACAPSGHGGVHGEALSCPSSQTCVHALAASFFASDCWWQQVVKPHVVEVTALALAEISFDPNLADGGDEEMDGGSGGDYDEYDDDFSDGDDYGDEEDMSWKVRRAACQLVVALVQAFPDLAPSLYGECRPVLLRRFSEREESVRLDVFTALSTLVRQRGASAGDDERVALAADAEKDISALMKQLRNTRNSKLRVRLLLRSTPARC